MSVTRAAPIAIPRTKPVAAPTVDPAFAALGGILRRATTKPRTRSAWPILGSVVTTHLIGVWWLLQVEAVRVALRDAAPTWVVFIAPPQTPARPQAVRATPQATPRLSSSPVTTVPPTAPVAAPSPTTLPSEPAQAVVAPATSAPVAVPSAPAPPAPPAAPRVVPASAVQYLVQPPVEVPLASRRLGEQGTVWLRVRVGRDGLPQQIAVQKSSGFERLDRQAMEAMRQARFKPQTENGQPIEWIVMAPLQYEID